MAAATAAAMAVTSLSRPASLLALPIARPATRKARRSNSSRRPQLLPNPCWRTWPADRDAEAAAAAGSARSARFRGTSVSASSSTSTSTSTSASASASGSTGGVPASKEEAVSQAAAALKNAIDSKRGNKKGSKSRGGGGGGRAGFSKQSSQPSQQQQQQRRLSVELPLADVSPEAAAELLLHLVRPLSIAQDPSASLCIVSADSRMLAACTQQLTDAAANIRANCLAILLDDSDDVGVNPQQQSDVMFLIAPDDTHQASITTLLNTTTPSTTIVSIAPQFLPDSYSRKDSLAANFESVYCFLPLQIQGFFSRMEGAIVRAYGGSGPVGGTNWRIYVKDAAGDMKMITQLPKRPEPAQIETVFYNYVGMESPLTKAAKAIKSSLPFGGGAGKAKG